MLYHSALHTFFFTENRMNRKKSTAWICIIAGLLKEILQLLFYAHLDLIIASGTNDICTRNISA